ncbi:XdhC family protein [Microbacterium trichothecenolyticum]|uniref:XdhC family protein n=1 Tax=Microbacterium trichothecenolyticum TaxID=69370 RepID=UPI001C6F18EA|nr:XdhC/CoxI family protein [Microbacterium trichothecenolyticum]MBW9120305.1 XdhC family protein [Microbacterium trichothecenolyticum]
MLELARDLLPLLASGVPVAAVTVTRVARSAPRGPGATMAVTADGRVIGSISGGCVEGDAVLLAHHARLTGRPQAARLGFSDDAAHAAGLACGGSVDVIAYPVSAEDHVIGFLEAAAAGRGVTIGIVLSGASAGQAMDERMLRLAVAADTLAPAIGARDSLVLPGACGGHDVLAISSAPRPRLLLLGAGEHAAALCRVATAAGFAVEVCDVWPTLVTRERFPDAVRLVAELPQVYLAGLEPEALDTRSAICVLTHDERVDVPSLEAALALPVGFVGAMGARATVARRDELLRERGVPEDDLARVHTPLGLDLGGPTPEETAVSVLAEIIAARHGGSGAALRERSGPLHRRAPTAAPPAAPDVDASPAAPVEVAARSCAASIVPFPAGATGAS